MTSLSSRSGMRLGVRGKEQVVVDPRVDLGRAHRRVSEEFLYDAQVGTVSKHVRRTRVPHDVRRDVPLDSGDPRILADDVPRRLTRDSTAPTAQEDRVRVGPGALLPRRQHVAATH